MRERLVNSTCIQETALVFMFKLGLGFGVGLGVRIRA